MVSRRHVDPARVIEEVFYTALHRLFHNEGARSHFGFAHINAFSLSDGLPGWHLWFADRAGAYQMSLIRADCGVSGNQDSSEWITGRWRVRYYPAMDEAVLARFSAIENLARLGPLFDATGTPTPAGQEQLYRDLFVVGSVDVRIPLDRGFIEIAGISQDRWREIRPEGLYLDNEDETNMEVVAPGDLDRNVPGWEMTFFFYDRLLCGLCHAYGSSPTYAIDATRPAWQQEVVGRRQARPIPDPEAVTRLTCVGLPLPFVGDKRGLAGATCDNACQRLKSEGWHIVEAATDPDNAASLCVNPLWWSIREQTFTPPHGAEGHMCCYHDH